MSGPTAGTAEPRHEAPALRPRALRCEHRVAPLGIDEPEPRLSWSLTSGRRGDDPVAYRVRVAERPEDLDDDGVPLWDTGLVRDPEAIAVQYAGPVLKARTRYHWRVGVWSASAALPAEATDWFETALLASDPWQASWITHDPNPVDVVDAPTEGEQALDHHGLTPCPLLRRTFTAPAAAHARLYVSARGLYEVRLNGVRVGDAELAPGWTDYHHRVQYQTYDVTGLIRDGENVLAATVADGWWSGFVGFEPRRAGAHYGSAPQFLAELQVTGADGTKSTVVTDGQWRTHTGPIRHADLLMGECHDLRYTIDGWDRPGFDDRSWSRAVAVDTEHGPPVASVDEPVRATTELRPRSIRRLPGRNDVPDSSVVHIVDFGQNIAGRVRLRAEGLAPGARVVVRHAEALDADQRLYTANLRTAAATDTLIGDGRQHAFLEPRFTYHGFRYAEITGLGQLSDTDIVAVALHSDTPWAGRFDCSDPAIRRLHECVVWGQRSNFVSVPTDCPQRDERLGWLADAQVFLPTAALNADVAAFFVKWLRDIEDARTPDGGFTNVAPRLVGVADEGAPGWGDAGVIVPWHLYRTYGDPRFLARSLDAMCAWVALIHRHNPDLIWRHRVGPHFSDWLAPGPPTPRELIATAYFAHSAQLTARAAEVLGRPDIAHDHERLAERIRERFVAHFVTIDQPGSRSGPRPDPGRGLVVRLTGDTQTGYLVALAFGLLPPECVAAAAHRLAELIEEAGPALRTGFLGVALAAPVLDGHGRADLAHELLRRTEVPSWLFPLRHGATTIWERWDGWTPEAGFRAPSMNSFNHYALGSIGEWLYRGVAGIDQSEDSIAYRHLRVRPRPGGLTHADARYVSARGTIAVSWHRHGDSIALRVEVPPGARADVHVPTHDPTSVRESGAVPATDGDHIICVGTGTDHVRYRVASGTYHFTAAYPAAGTPSAAGPALPSLAAGRPEPSWVTAAPAGSPEEDTP